MTNDPITELLAELRKDQHAIHLAVIEIKGENRLQSQVLAFHVDQLKEFKLEIELITKNLSERVDKLEKWQVKIAAIISVVAVTLSLFSDAIKDAFLK